MRVLVVTNMYPSPARPALGRFVADQVEALRALDGIEVELFAFEPGGPGRYVRAAAELRRRHRHGRFDVVHAHYGLTGWVARVVPGAHVVTFHGTDLADRRAGPLSRALARIVDLPAPVSAALARERLGGVAGRRPLAVLPCGVDLERFRPQPRVDARSELGLAGDGRYLAFPADPARPEKRHDRAAALARELDAELIDYRGVDPERAPLVVNAANAVVAPSQREGFGLAPLEALACDVPVLATPVGIAPIALRGVAGTLCAPFSVERWAAAALPHLEAADPRVEGRARAALYSRNRFAERVLMAYRDVVRQPDPTL